jgi:predicted O-methyltransferase YrrM
MYSDVVEDLPRGFADIETASRAIGFSMPSDLQTGALLKTLVGSKPGGRVLEIGTGTGLATAWLLAGMDADSTLLSLDSEQAYQTIAAQCLGDDNRLTLVCTDGGQWIDDNNDAAFDLIFADAWPGKYSKLDQTLALLKPGGMYIIDDMLPQPNWPSGHDQKALELVDILEQRHDIQLVKLAWSTGLMIVVKK